MAKQDEENEPSTFSAEVGQRMRAVRKLRGLSLEEVEATSGGKWSASALGAYERGFRNLSLPRLHELASFYDVPMSELLGEGELIGARSHSGRLVLDLVALQEVERPDAEAVLHYLRSIILERGDYNGRVLSIRRDDLRALCSLLQSDEATTMTTLAKWGAIVHEGKEEMRR